jgi:hypothetical protein
MHSHEQAHVCFWPALAKRTEKPYAGSGHQPPSFNKHSPQTANFVVVGGDNTCLEVVRALRGSTHWQMRLLCQVTFIWLLR